MKDIQISDYDYPLPDERIARHPLAVRDSCLLLVAGREGAVRHEVFRSLPELLPDDSLLVCNDTRVINARIRFTKSTGAEVEVFLLEPLSPEDYNLMFQSHGSCRWSCMVGNLKRWKGGLLEKELEIDGKKVVLSAERLAPRDGNAHEVVFSWDDPQLSFADIIDAAGYIPIPPYLKRASEASDSDDYQTVYARIRGSVAAPTAGLHFTPELFDAIKAKGVKTGRVTLHVGAGTFQPVKSEEIGGHPMHTEVFCVSRELVGDIIDALESGRKVVAVGTTTVRTLESLPYIGAHLLEDRKDFHVDQWEAYERAGFDTLEAMKAVASYMDAEDLPELTASTSIMIAPGFKWRLVSSMVTNFHQPKSTLLLLVSSFLGEKPGDSNPRWREVYDEALRGEYRFLSYGDACYFY